MHRRKGHLFAAAFGTSLLFAQASQADVSTWLFLGGGASFLRQSGMVLDPRGSFELSTGMGTSPSAPIVFGGLIGFQTQLAAGTDFSLLARSATRGFAQGNWGFALDLGGYARGWSDGSSGGIAALVLGAPWGLTLDLKGGLGTNDSRQFSATLGIDLARLTVMRQSGLNWFLNPSSAK